ncbi:MAG: hypothetical protein ACLR0U_18055 [Enterocloster clostridioformis]
MIPVQVLNGTAGVYTVPGTASPDSGYWADYEILKWKTESLEWVKLTLKETKEKEQEE